ncbi:E3 ubiquitin-protein ligase EL5-like [Panicum virgatum]|uniref:RING-type domain-containing protein n=1 Tax=Panicum virgatum TaxID=38727 RepID=A0A8T0V804_PANVG|nr:E3 ubiquitin-protein ligase EL5-like [Panicum virgatum]KAG2630485.1 hypothetical protein PVAP13_3KG566400 [Panicum virgatum]
MAPPPAPLAAEDATPPPPSLKSALLITGGLLLFAIAAIVLLRCLLRRWASSSSRPGAGRMAEVEQGEAARRTGAAGRELAEAGEATRRTAAAGREQVEAEAGAATRIAAEGRRGEAPSARERQEVELRGAGAGDGGMERLIASLPLFTMASALAALPKNSPDCAVCLAAFEPDAGLRLLPACRHAFHDACIGAWLRTNPVCPICRSAVAFPLPPLPAAAAGQEPLGSRAGSRSFRVELGSVSNRRSSCDDPRRTYSLGGSFDYRVDEEVEAIVSRIVRPAAAAAARPSAAAPAAPGEALAEEVGSRGWLGEYLDRVAASASSLSGRWSGRLSHGRRSHSLRHDDSCSRDPAAKSATPAAVAAPGEEAPAEAAGSRGRPGERRDRDNLAPSAPSLSGRWSRRWSQGHRRDESRRWDPEAACRTPREEEEREPALVALGRWIFGF